MCNTTVAHIRVPGRRERSMGRLDVLLPDELEREFRIQVATRLGGTKGAISKAVAEALRLWMKEDGRRKK